MLIDLAKYDLDKSFKLLFVQIMLIFSISYKKKKKNVFMMYLE